jgi:hypothetical protein
MNIRSTWYRFPTDFTPRALHPSRILATTPGVCCRYMLMLSSTRPWPRVVNHSFLQRRSSSNKKGGSATEAVQSRTLAYKGAGNLERQIRTVLQWHVLTNSINRKSGQKQQLQAHTVISSFRSSKEPSRIRCACLIKLLYKVHLYMKIILNFPNICTWNFGKWPLFPRILIEFKHTSWSFLKTCQTTQDNS